MPGASTQPHPPPSLTRNKTTTASVGLQLLSPTLQQSIQKTKSTPNVLSSGHAADYCDWSTTPPVHESPIEPAPGSSSDDDEGGHRRGGRPRHVEREADAKHKDKRADEAMAFNFDGFTLAAVREREQRVEPDATEVSGLSSSQASYANSLDMEQHALDETGAPSSFDEAELSLKPLSRSLASVVTTTTTEDLEHSRRQRHFSFNKQIERASITGRTPSEYTTRNTFQLSTPALSSTGFHASHGKKHHHDVSSVTMRGWLQKRKGVVLKRWKVFFCLLKSDDSLCLFSSEDTVHGRLVHHYQVLKAVLSDKKDSFYIIGVDLDGAPRREEFRTIIAFEWTRWFQALSKYFDNTCMYQAMERKRANSILPGSTTASDAAHRSYDSRTHGWSGSSQHTNYKTSSRSMDGDAQLSYSSISEVSGVSSSTHKDDGTPSTFHRTTPSSCRVDRGM
ncbi:hypothetical protein PsorP6_010336 [Peronosclerospora sorghi]|uniref:Uncharacterized protein n=1 Tax=Peronosclerospora sorghi TaxID=230839 RepID=A0ACC0VX68_9STRA|nr:hypothetical protein PsorP6_010336 [Peronosclerospora sorghi]